MADGRKVMQHASAPIWPTVEVTPSHKDGARLGVGKGTYVRYDWGETWLISVSVAATLRER